MAKTLYLILTENGFLEAFDDILKQKAALWINPNILTGDNIQSLKQANISPHILEQEIQPGNEKAVLNIINRIEKEDNSINIMVEYP